MKKVFEKLHHIVGTKQNFVGAVEDKGKERPRW